MEYICAPPFSLNRSRQPYRDCNFFLRVENTTKNEKLGGNQRPNHYDLVSKMWDRTPHQILILLLPLFFTLVFRLSITFSLLHFTWRKRHRNTARPEKRMVCKCRVHKDGGGRGSSGHDIVLFLYVIICRSRSVSWKMQVSFNKNTFISMLSSSWCIFKPMVGRPVFFLPTIALSKFYFDSGIFSIPDIFFRATIVERGLPPVASLFRSRFSTFTEKCVDTPSACFAFDANVKYTIPSRFRLFRPLCSIPLTRTRPRYEFPSNDKRME